MDGLMWTTGELAWFVFCGILLGVVLAGRGKDRKSKPLSRLLALLLEPVYYWLDLYGPDNRPSHSKVAYFGTLVVMVAGVVTLGVKEIEQGGSVTLNFVIFSVATMAYGLGRSAYNAFLHSVLGDKLASVMQARASVPVQRPPGMEDSA